MRAIAAVGLAAGGSSRLGQPKQLLQLGGRSLVSRAVSAATDAGCAPIVVVVGGLRSQIQSELLNFDSVVLVENEAWKLGLGTSIRCGVERLLELDTGYDALVLLTCDQPMVIGGTIRALIDEHDSSGQPIVASSYAGTVGIPALFERSCTGELLRLPTDSGAKPLIESRPNEVALVEFPEGAVDVDTPADAERLKHQGW